VTTSQPDPVEPLQVVLTDACVLYSRVLRDYLLYAAEYLIIAVAWSQTILDEVTSHLMDNIPGFDEQSAARLVAAMTKTFPYARRDPGPADYQRLADMTLPDEGDRHVLAAALAAQADIVCTANLVLFPPSITCKFQLSVMSPDQLICHLVEKHPETMVLVHQTSVANLAAATDESTIEALRRAGAPAAARAMARLLFR